jgi:hypothetical protein
MRFKKIEEISVDESKKIFGGIGISEDCDCSGKCSCECGECACNCEKKEKDDEAAGKSTTYVGNGLSKGVVYYSSKAGDATGVKAKTTMT